jgi:hypothetical protein
MLFPPFVLSEPRPAPHSNPSTTGCVTSFSTRACSSILIRPARSSTPRANSYNNATPHSSLGLKTPAAYAGTLTEPKDLSSVEALIAPN